jgi:site-specific DNA-methyltransferase (adenine-specific)
MEILPDITEATVDLVFVDPPFNLGKDYGQGIDDERPDAAYLARCSSWIAECVRLLKPGGALYLFNLPRWNVEFGHQLNASRRSSRSAASSPTSSLSGAACAAAARGGPAARPTRAR